MGKIFAGAATAMVWLCGSAGAAIACPDITSGLETVTHTAPELYSPVEMDVVAGGGVNLSECSDVPGVGYIIEEPDFSLFYERDAKYALEFRTESNCDTILLVNDSGGTWHHDDDSGDEDNALIRLSGATDGRYDIWVGTYTSDTCDAKLILETF